MFQNPFAFDGRIRRLEYGLSLIIYVFVYGIALSLISVSGIVSVIGILLLIPMIWFLWAQGAKRCHDIDRAGWMQIIPFYVFFLLFENGNPMRNEYGVNPKFPDMAIDPTRSETLDGHLIE